MPVLGSLNISDDVEIEFSAHGDNGGSSILNSGYVPLDGTPAPPVNPAAVAVAPGASAIQRTRVGAAFSLLIDVDVPSMGTGTLVVSVNGEIIDREEVRSDDNYSYIVV